MDGMLRFSVLSLFRALSINSPIDNDQSIKRLIQFYIAFFLAIFATIAAWVVIAFIGSMIFIPIDLALGTLLTVGGTLAIFAGMFILMSQIVNAVEQYIRYVLENRHKHALDNTRKLDTHFRNMIRH